MKGKKFDAAEKHFQEKEIKYRKKIKFLEERLIEEVNNNLELNKTIEILKEEKVQMEDWVSRLLEYTELDKEDIKRACEKDKEISAMLKLFKGVRRRKVLKGKGMKYLSERISPDYVRQQRAIVNACGELGLVPYYPDYHGKERDKNTVLVYLPEDEAYNKKLESEGYSYMPIYGQSSQYRNPIWTFENSDINGNESYGFANFGSLDLRGDDEKVIRGSIRLAYYQKMQNRYVASQGGVLGVKEADETYNDYNRSIIESFIEVTKGKACFVKINGKPDEPAVMKPEPPFYNFCCDFVIPAKDKELEDMIFNFRKTASGAKNIVERIEKLHGLDFVWF